MVNVMAAVTVLKINEFAALIPGAAIDLSIYPSAHLSF